jgi:amino acid adenylation domain-containing protein
MEKEVFIFPSSFAQQRLWFQDQLEPSGSAYNMSAAFRATGRLHLAALEQSLNEIVTRHEVLRTTFEIVDDQVVQLIDPNVTWTLAVNDLRTISRLERETTTQHLMSQEVRRPFDLVQGPLFRVTLIQVDEDEHILLFTIHHIIFDGWSMGILFRELSTLYEGFCKGQPASLPELAIQYTDFAIWQREWFQGEVLQEQVSYWKKKLDGVATLDLPTDWPRPKVQTFRGAKQSLTLPKSLGEELRRVSQQSGGTLFMTLLAAFAILLHRYTGQGDVAVGVPIAGRNRTEIEPLIGFFVNTLILRTELSGNPTFRQLLTQVRATAVDAYAHQDLPFEKLVEELHPERDLSRTPLFQVFFNVTRTDGSGLSLHELTVNRITAGEPKSKFDITFYVKENRQEIDFELVYNRDLFRPDTMSRMLGHFQRLLNGIAANPECRVSDLPILTQPETQQLLLAWNGAERDCQNDKCIHELFEAQVERTPNSVAVLFADQTLTYSRLNERANQVARCLRRLGVGPEMPVGLCMERSLEMIIGLLAILKAGGAYVPLDPEYPQARLAYMTDQTQVGFLLTMERLLTHFPVFEGRVLCLDRDFSLFEPEERQNLEATVDPANLAYVIHTSGSTGKPKAVLGFHRGVTNYFSYLCQTYNLSRNDTVIQIPSLSFDASLRDLVGPLTAGAQVVIVNAFDVKDPAALLAEIKKHRVTCILSIVPSLLHELVDVVSTRAEKNDSLRLILVSGEALLTTLCEKAKRVFGDSTWIVNQYGPTESTLTSSYHRVSAADFDRRLAPLGKPISNTRMCILDEYLNLAPMGIPGELHIGGVGISRGYINAPDLTAERFIPDPLSDEFGTRLYKTGDLARYMPDGTIEFLGRIDHQVKIRGFRVELGEIEVVLTQHPAVEQALGVAREDVDGLVAYIVTKKNQAPTVEDLRRFLKHDLPEYMVPSDFILLDAFPLTPNRKVDRRALPAPGRSRTDRDHLFSEPRNPIEQRIADIWAEILKLECLGVHDNFFDLGGHSLLATRVISRIRQEFQTDLPLRTLFENPTIAGVAAHITEMQQKRAVPEKLKEVLADLDLLSDEEAETQLRLKASGLV